MRRPPLSPLLLLAVSLGVGSGALEVALRVSPRLGMGYTELASLLGANVVLSIAWLLLAALVAQLIGRRRHGLVLAALVLVHGALAWRFDLVLNLYLSDPRVWGGLLGIGVLSLGLGLLLDPLVERARVALSLLAGLVGIVSVGLAIVRSESPTGEPPGGLPNVVVITMDTVRADRLSVYGADNDTPVIARLAREGALFETVVATAPVTEPSHLAIFTGQPPYQSGVAANGTRLGDRPALLWRALQDRGWTTAGFVAGFPLHSRFDWAQGMDVYDDDFGAFRGLHSLSLVKAWDQVVLPAHTLRERRGDLVVDRALAWLDGHQDERFFLWVHLFDPHAPYEAPDHPFDPPTDGSPLNLPAYWPPPHKAITSTDWLVDAYEAEIRYTDAQIGRLVDALEAHGVLDQTIIVVTADHGESLTEHDYFFEHGDNLYDPSLLVPLVLRYPPLVRAGHRVPCQVSNEDVTPTVLGLLDLDAAADQQALERAGRDLSVMARGGACEDARILSSTVSVRYVDQPPVDHSLREPARKLIRMGKDSHSRCFDLVADPGELAPLDCAPDLSGALDQALSGGAQVVSPETDNQTNAALEALGYIDGEE